MKPTVISAGLLSLLLASATATAGDARQVDGFEDEGPDEHLLFAPDEIQWEDGPGSLEPGAEMAMLEGDLAEPEIFTMRLRFPDGFTIAPHSHPNVERLTVISGTFYLGTGDEMDPDTAEPLEAGSYMSMPPGTNHYAIAEGETIVQISTLGPWEVEYVDPEDDPREQE